jgi:alpha-beta hydrolase superfamily lysophospholipase
MSNRENKITSLKNLGYSVLIFDYSGYGKSSGVPSEQQLYDDGCLMISLLRQTYPIEKIILYGESMGCAVATYVARRYGIQKLILESPIIKIQNIINHRFKLLSFCSFIFPEFDTEIYLNGYLGKSMVIHSPTDEVIPYELTRNLRELCTVHIQSSGSHNYQNIPWQEIQKFLLS